VTLLVVRSTCGGEEIFYRSFAMVWQAVVIIHQLQNLLKINKTLKLVLPSRFFLGMFCPKILCSFCDWFLIRVSAVYFCEYCNHGFIKNLQYVNFAQN